MNTLIDERVKLCREGQNPCTIAKVTSGWVVLGDVQFLRGYCLLLPDPVVPDLNSLNEQERKTYLYEVSVIGDALLQATDAHRINYEILGNSEAALHTHIFPRYTNEPQELKPKPVWFYDWSTAPEFDLERDKPLMEQIAAYLTSQGLVL